MNLAIVVPVLGQKEMAAKAISFVHENMTRDDTNVLVIDQSGSLIDSVGYSGVFKGTPNMLVYHCTNMGVYPTFKLGFELQSADILLFIHSDLFITEKGFDDRIVKAFEENPHLGLLGFIGSNEIDAAGGRGLGTTSNFQGGTYHADNVDMNPRWLGSPAHVHGKVNAGLTRAAVVDGCSMAIRREAWEKIGYRENFPPHHFYDRLISTQILEAGYQVAVLGIACDHISGQTVNVDGTGEYTKMAQEWAEKHIPADRWAGNPPNWAWDQTLYWEAERQWLGEYRDLKRLVPVKV